MQHTNDMDVPSSHYRNAVYMNNAAVRLMLHGQHRASHDALRCAIRLMANILQSNNILLRAICSRPSAESCSRDVLDGRSSSMPTVQSITRQLAKLSSSSDKFHQQRPIQVRRMRLDGSIDPSWIDNQLDSNATICEGIAMYIEDTLEEDSQGDMYEMTCAIVLSNLALNHFCSSTISKASSIRKAVQLLELSQNILGVQSKQCVTQVSEGSMYVAVMIWNNVCCFQQHDDACQTVDLLTSMETLTLVKSIVSELSQLHSACSVAANAA